MRTYGRVYDENGVPKWVVIQTDKNGLNDYVYVTALVQELKLNLGESPFWGNRGIPARPSVQTQVPPDYYTMLMQQRYSPFFMAIAIQRRPNKITDPKGSYSPVYEIDITTNYGVQINLQAAV